MRGKVISFINLKGGVAKTTTTVGTAFALASLGKKVLVIDLDPQTNATVMLIGENHWLEQDEKGLTIFHLFQDVLDERNDFSVKEAVLRGVGNIKDVKTVDLLPSSIKMVYLQDELIEIKYHNGFSISPINVLYEHLGPVTAKYDYTLIDCPPNLGILTLNGLKISDGYVIPVIPDILSTYGVGQFINRIQIFSTNVKHPITPLGLVATKVKQNTSLHTSRLSELKVTSPLPMFNTVFPENSRMAEAAEFREPLTFRQKWGYQGQVDLFLQFAKELMDRAG